MGGSWILSAARTPIGAYLGSLSTLSAPELGAAAIREAVARAGVDGERIDEVIMGCVLSAGLGQAPARQAALKAGIPTSVSALTINMVCGSGLKAVMLADQAVRAGDAEIVVAGGMESMSRAPHLVQGMRGGVKFGNQTIVDAMLHDGLWCAFDDCHMGMHAESTAEKFGATRAEQDSFAAESQRRAAKAAAEGAFDEEIVPVAVPTRKAPVVVARDEAPRPDTTVETLAALRTSFRKDGTVTAGNASSLSDGAAAVVVASEAHARRGGAAPLARIAAQASHAVEPRDLFIAPAFAVRRVLERAGWSPSDVDLFEINEAFSSQMVACIRQLEIPREKVNVHGGAVALGHPIGASGARVLTTLLYAMRRRGARRGVASLCLGGGDAVALAVEREQ